MALDTDSPSLTPPVDRLRSMSGGACGGHIAHLIFFCAAYSLLAWPLGAGAQDAAPTLQNTPFVSTEWVSYELQEGDSFARLITEELQLPHNKNQALNVIRKNNPSVSFLKPHVGASVRFPQQWIRPTYAQVSRLSCASARWPAANSKTIQLGTRLKEGDKLEVPAECQVELTLEDTSRITLPSAATVKLSMLRYNMSRKVPDVRIELTSGRVATDVNKLRPAGSIFEIRTPSALTGVRGTQFNVSFDADAHSSGVEVLSGRVATLGKADTQGVAVATMQGVKVSGSGQAQDVETLPHAPKLLKHGVLSNHHIDFTFTPSDAAHRYIFFTRTSINGLNEVTRPPSSSLTTNAPIENGLSTLLGVRGMTASGLYGPQGLYALCQADGFMACHVQFDSSMARGERVHLTLSRQDGHDKSLVVLDQIVPFTADAFMVKNLPDGKYNWTLQYTMPRQSPFEKPRQVQESGEFQLLVLPLSAQKS